MINSYQAGMWGWRWVKSTFFSSPSPVSFLVSERGRFFSLITYHSSGISSFWKKCHWFLIAFPNTLVTFKARLVIALVAPPAFRFTGFKNWTFLNKLTSKGNFCCIYETETWKNFKQPFLNFSQPSSEIMFWANIAFAFVHTSIIQIGLTFFSALTIILIFSPSSSEDNFAPQMDFLWRP